VLKVFFGLELDGYVPPRTQTRCGEVILGPLGLLNLLETRLGLRGLWEGEPVRTIQYLRCLREADNGEHFYSRSLAVDELAVARTLLGWRDTWVEAGWTGTLGPAASRRLQDMATVETLARKHLAAGAADRLQGVLRTFQDNRLPDMTVEVIADCRDLPSVWQEILDRLHHSERPPAFLSKPPAPPGSDLARLQQALLDNQPVQLAGDGSVVFLRAGDQNLLGRGVSQIVHGTLQADKSRWFGERLPTTLVDGGSAAILDMISEGENQPLSGVSTPSRWRPPLQVLPLALSLFWAPLDPSRLLEFLTHPVSPLPRRVRSRLANVVAEYPGIGGEAWQKTLADLIEAENEKTGGEAKAGDELRRRLDQWLLTERFDAEQGAPLQRIAEQCARVCRWSAVQAEREDLDPSLRALFFVASAQSSQAQQTLDALTSTGQERIGRLQLERLLDQVTALGVPVPALPAELGHLHLCRSPGAVIESNARVLWWHFSEPTLPARWPWSAAELEHLAQNGARLTATDSRLQTLSAQWLQPVLAATQQVVFALPASAGGEAPRHHPLWDRICALTGKTVPALDVGRLLTVQEFPAELTLRLSSLPHQGLPRPQRWWQLSRPQLLAPRASESFSSLQAFVDSPYQWVLKHKASLYAGSLARIDDGNRQKGNLFHRLFEKLFSASELDWRKADQKAVGLWVASRFERLLAEEGANFLLPGRLREKQEMADTARRSTWALLEFLRQARVVEVEMEKSVDGSFTGGPLVGSIDLLVTNDRGEEAVIDLKWSGVKYRRAELQENRALQLAIYAYLRRKQGRWPAQAFYMLSDGRLLAPEARFFPTAEVCAPADPNASVASLWLAFEKTWKWRRQQLDQGLIEVTVQGTAKDVNSDPPDDCLAIDEHNDRFNDFAALTGWQEGE
jgi:hypothetical protein